MPTIARGNTAEIYCPIATSVTFTPGSGGSIRVAVSAQSGSPSVAPQFIQSATSVAVTAGSTVFAEAITADATYTTPAGADSALSALVSGAWNQQPVSFDAALARVCVFGQFADGAYLCTSQTDGSFARRLFRLTGDPVAGGGTVSVLSQTTVFSGLKNTLGTDVFDAGGGIQNAWIMSNGDVFFMWKNAANQYFLHRAKASTYTVGSDAGYSNLQSCIDIGRYGATHYDNIRAFSPRALLEFTNSAGTRVLLFCEYNTKAGRDLNGGPLTGDAVIVWRSVDGGTTWAIFLEFCTGGAGTHRFDHFHGAVQDPYTGLVYFLTGDDGAENSIIQWDGVSAAPAANASIATIGATAGWRIRNNSELLRYTDILFAPTCIYSIPDCDTESAEATTTGFVSTVIDKSLGWVGTTAPVARLTDVPPAIAVKGRQYSAIVSFTAAAGERYLHVWTVDGQPENGASWTLVAKLRTYAAGPVSVPRSWFIDAAGNLWCGGVSGQGVHFSPEVQSGTSVRLRPVARRAGVDVYDLT